MSRIIGVACSVAVIGLLGCRPASVIGIPQPSDDGGQTAVDLALRDSFPDALPDATGVRPDLRALTFNTHLFFDTVCDSGRCGPSDFEQVSSPQLLAARADAVTQALRSRSADVVALQEIENQSAFSAITSRLRDVYPTMVLGETGLPGSIDVAVLGKGTLLAVRTHRDQILTRPDGSKTTFSRELLEVHMLLRGQRVVMCAAHFRSKVSDDPGRRLAEAQATRDILLATAAEFPDAVVLLGGDLNDTPSSPPLEALEISPLLLRVGKDRPLSSIATYSWNGMDQAIDHLLVVRSARASYLLGTAAAQHDSTRFGLAGSDHAALLADFAIH
jgi:endonuclease/exonuclease/phosphatase family metal-dependent hydrolase